MDAYAIALEKKIEEAKEEFEDDLNQLKAELPEENIKKFAEKEEIVKLGFQRDIENPMGQKKTENGASHLLSNINFLELPFGYNRQVEGKVKELRSDLEPLCREVQLLRPESENQFIQGLWWATYQGTVKFLDLLKKLEDKPPFKREETVFLLQTAQKEIYKRECKDLRLFYDLSEAELPQVIDKMIRNEKEDDFASLPEIFAPLSIAKSIIQLEETRKMIEKIYEGEKLKNWLNTSNDDFLGENPKNVILKGKVFRILQHFIRLGEGIT